MKVYGQKIWGERMRYTVPDYYKKFQCLAGVCPATCCAGWQIVIDPKSLARYHKVRGSFGNRIRNSVNWKEETFLQYEKKRCAFLNEENLCDMHIEAGPEMMCATCRKYPRHIEEFENEREITLSMSCPAVAKIILEKQEPVTMRTAEDDRQEEEAGFDFFLYSALQDTREVMLNMLQNRKYPVHLRMAEVLALAHDVQGRIRSGQIFEIETILTRYEKGEMALIRKLCAEKGRVHAEELLCLLDEWEVLDEHWKKDVAVWKQCAQPLHPGNIPENEKEQMVVYYLYTYFCGAVYDGDALAKAKMAIVSTLIWEELCRAEEAQKGEILSFEDRVELAYRYSRELEHSDPNLNQMEVQMNTREETSFPRLLGILAARAEVDRNE